MHTSLFWVAIILISCLVSFGILVIAVFLSLVSINTRHVQDMQQKAVISLTTTPSRVQQIKPTLNALSKANLPIFLTLPKSKDYGDISWITLDFPLITVLRPLEDHGPAMKILGVLETNLPGDTIIFICDDDILYPVYLWKNLYNKLSRDTTQTQIWCTKSWNCRELHLPVFSAVWGVAIRKKHIPLDRIYAWPDVKCKRGDDLWLSYVAQTYGGASINQLGYVKKIVTMFHMHVCNSKSFAPEARGNATSNQQNYQKCITSIQRETANNIINNNLAKK